jgi:hypothetical protein
MDWWNGLRERYGIGHMTDTRAQDEQRRETLHAIEETIKYGRDVLQATGLQGMTEAQTPLQDVPRAPSRAYLDRLAQIRTQELQQTRGQGYGW